MKNLLRTLAALLVAVSGAIAGDCLSGSGCCNACPLAREASARYSTGGEAYLSNAGLRKEFVRSVLENLRRI